MDRRAPLIRRTPLARDGAGARRFTSKRRKRLAVVSPQQHDDRDRQADVRARVFARDGYRCVLWHRADQGEIPPCRGPLTFGHRRHAGAGGAYIVENGITLCLGHNRWCEDEPDLTRALGGTNPAWLVVREGDQEWEQLGRKAARVR